ncbi:MAG: hypothetical protein OXC19_09925, partial [Bryobacterales bacterium]|nr:hypothetical protein [Bryobacterales bacterium]
MPATTYRFVVYDRESGYRVEPPADASEIRISYQSTTPGVDVDLFVRAGSENLPWDYADDGAPRRRNGGRKLSVQPCCRRDEGRSLGAAV